MKKKLFLLLIFALFLSVFTVNFTSVKAESSPSDVSVAVEGSYASYFKQDTLEFNADYSVFNNLSSLSFKANSLSDNFTYKWQIYYNKDYITISESSTLNLYKTLSTTSIENQSEENLKLNLILVGTTKYRLIATNANDQSTITKNINVIITQLNEKYELLTYCSLSQQSVITKVSPSFKIYACLPIAKADSTNWYLKSPNGVSYNLKSANTNVFEFSPENLITDQNGHGTYKLYAVATENKKTYTSDVFEFVSMPSAPTPDANSYKIVRKEIKNTKTQIQAFEYTIEEKGDGIADASVLEASKILWYVNGNLISNGRTFKYEPSTTEAYHVSAKHLNQDGSILQLASFREQPSSTGIGMLLIIIAVAVAVLIGIFTISVVIINKKRDVVW